MEMSFPSQASKKIKSRMETGKKMPRMKPQIFENKQNLSLVQHTTVCLATKAAATAETAAKTSALLHEARASPRFPPHAAVPCQTTKRHWEEGDNSSATG